MMNQKNVELLSTEDLENVTGGGNSLIDILKSGSEEFFSGISSWCSGENWGTADYSDGHRAETITKGIVSTAKDAVLIGGAGYLIYDRFFKKSEDESK